MQKKWKWTVRWPLIPVLLNSPEDSGGPFWYLGPQRINVHLADLFVVGTRPLEFYLQKTWRGVLILSREECVKNKWASLHVDIKNGFASTNHFQNEILSFYLSVHSQIFTGYIFSFRNLSLYAYRYIDIQILLSKKLIFYIYSETMNNE